MPSEERIKELLLDAMAGRLPPPVPVLRLPDKSAQPKVLALDCNKWIALGQVHYGRSTNAAATSALESVRRAVAAGTLIVPLHFINAIEAMQRENPGSRERLVRFMVEISGNWFFRPFFDIASAEMRGAVLRLFTGATDAADSPRSALLAYGLPGMYGPAVLPANVLAELEKLGGREMLERWWHSPEATIEGLVDELRKNSTVARAREREDSAVQRMQRSRDTDAHLSARERRRLELENQWDSPAGERLRRVLEELSIAPSAFRAWLGEGDNVEVFWDAVPSTQVALALEIESAKNSERDVHRNDLRDMSFYEATLPYANILVTENYWEDRIRQAKLGDRYDTRVLRDLADLPAALAAAGCQEQGLSSAA